MNRPASNVVEMPYLLRLKGFTISHIEHIVRDQEGCDGPDRCFRCREIIEAIEELKQSLRPE